VLPLSSAASGPAVAAGQGRGPGSSRKCDWSFCSTSKLVGCSPWRRDRANRLARGPCINRGRIAAVLDRFRFRKYKRFQYSVSPNPHSRNRPVYLIFLLAPGPRASHCHSNAIRIVCNYNLGAADAPPSGNGSHLASRRPGASQPCCLVGFWGCYARRSRAASHYIGRRDRNNRMIA
jgi:hypothetical protein